MGNLLSGAGNGSRTALEKEDHINILELQVAKYAISTFTRMYQNFGKALLTRKIIITAEDLNKSLEKRSRVSIKNCQG